MATIPKDFRYTKEHEWASYDPAKKLVTIGITDYAAEKLGEIVFVELPEEGSEVGPDDNFGVVESTKSVSDLFSPVGGTVAEINDVLIDTPEIINEDPYDEGWMIKVKVEDESDFEELMTADDYEAFIGELEEE